MSTRRASLSFLIAAIAMAVGCESTTRRPSDTDSDEDGDYWGGTGTGTGGAGTGTGTSTKTNTSESCDGNVECETCQYCQTQPGGVCESLYSQYIAGDDSVLDALLDCLGKGCPMACEGTGGGGGGTTTGTTSTSTTTAATCDNTGNCQGCADCATDPGASCESAYNACVTNQDCVDLWDCLNPCQNQACVDACADAYSNGISDYNDLLSCIVDYACPNDCN